MAKSLNKLKEEEINKTVKILFKEGKWKFKSNFAYKEINDFFFFVMVIVSSKTSNITATLSFKPMRVDEIFWEIVGLTENKKMPLSFRGDGAFTLPKIMIEGYRIPISEEKIIADINQIIKQIDDTLSEIIKKVNTIDAFIKYIENKPDKDTNLLYRDTLIVAHLANNDIKMAMRLIESEIKSNSIPRFQFGNKSFFD